jgi:hypothetical protein
MEEKAAMDTTEICRIQTHFARMEQDYKVHLHEAEADFKKLSDDVERERRGYEA